MMKVIMIMAGGAAGSALRYMVSGWGQRIWSTPFPNTSFPVGTLTVNVLGCLIIGVIGFLFAGPVFVREQYRAAVLVGVLGGFTTFSSFGYETLTLLNDGQTARALMNVILNNGLGLAAVWLGYRVTERIIGG